MKGLNNTKSGFQRWGLGWAFISAVLVAFSPACSTNDILTPETPTTLSNSNFQDDRFQPLQTADVVYLGESHDSAADHEAQLDIIQELYTRNPDMAIALEMFQRPFQPVIDRYLANEISEEELVIQTEYMQRWGFPWELYAPFLRFAKENDLPILALNSPNEISRKIAREGLESLEGDDLRYIPPLTEIDTSNENYREFVASAFGAHGSHGSFNFDNFFAAQVMWDETMAMTIADFKTASPNTQVVVLTGKGHVIYGYGIPDRVQRRLGDDLTQQIVLLNPDGFMAEAEGAIADFFWYSE
ncbi:MAG: ChaN family lipoprotein [Cyanobacteria bacterium P01_F01_bin.150]